MRIDKLLSQLKYGSRSDIKKMISRGLILVNEKAITDSSFQVDPTVEKIVVNQEVLFYKDSIHLAIYKPSGYLSAHHDAMHPCVIDLIKEPYNRFDYAMAGRLDIDTEGLMILTTDGQFAHQLMHPKYHLTKTYEATLDKSFTHDQELLAGVTILDGKNEPFTARALTLIFNKNHVTLEIDEGKFHQVKRMFKAVGYEVVHLKRTKIGILALHDFEPGCYREVRKEDIL
ncbi:MAG: pseudouridine synthase [Acholeplasmataceae bacterium]|jgi:16S rRNA pseudouridine516 synthase|nr:pseudouridine synthase [Acholeplasmataceae bacterium]